MLHYLCTSTLVVDSLHTLRCTVRRVDHPSTSSLYPLRCSPSPRQGPVNGGRLTARYISSHSTFFAGHRHIQSLANSRHSPNVRSSFSCHSTSNTLSLSSSRLHHGRARFTGAKERPAHRTLRAFRQTSYQRLNACGHILVRLLRRIRDQSCD